MFCDTRLSAHKIAKFIKKFNIDMTMVEKKTEQFNSFNDFFTRKLKSEARPISKNKKILISPGDGRMKAYDNINLEKIVQIKGLTYSLKELIGSHEIAEKYAGGVCIVLRLAPIDYHRYHFMDSGYACESHKIKGDYYSVNPIALENTQKLFCENKREWSLFKSDNFDEVLYVEVGATCVGTIIQTYNPGMKTAKGEEKGFFKFGGSTVILFFKKDCVQVDDDILEQTELGYECKVKLGERIGCKVI